MKKKKILLGLALLASIALSSCDNNNANVSTPSTNKTPVVNVKKDRGTVDTNTSKINIPDVFINTATVDSLTYSVVHQLQNDEGGYDTVAVESFQAEAGDVTNAKEKVYNGYVVKPFEQLTVKADGSTSVVIKYDLKQYSINLVNAEFGGSLAGGGTYNVNNNQATLEAKPYIGYRFVGWFNGNQFISSKQIISFEVMDDMNIRGVFEIRDEFKCFDFTSNEETCTINKLLDYSIKMLEIPEGVTSIGNQAFYGSNLYKVVLPTTLKSIGNEAFYNSRLLSVTFKSVISLNYGIFDYNIKEVINLTGMPFSTMDQYDNYYVESEITDPDNTMLIEDENGYLFANIDYEIYLVGYTGSDLKLELPLHPNNIEEITSYKIYNYAFSNSDIISITIPSTVSDINYCAFENCTKLIEVYNLSPNINISEGESNYSYGYLGQYAKTIHNDIVSPSIIYSTDDYDYIVTGEGDEAYATIINYKNVEKENVVINKIGTYPTVVGKELFKNSELIKSLTLGEGVVAIEDGAFYNCPNLRNVNMTSIVSIGQNAFYEDYDIYQIELPKVLENIDYNAFYGCHIFEIINNSSLEIEIDSYSNGSIAYYAQNVVKDKSNSVIKTTEDGFVYATLNDLKGIIKYIGNEKEIVISDDYDIISDYAFANSKITKISIDPSVEVYDNAFYNAADIEYMAIPIDNECFYYYFGYYEQRPTKLKTVIINNDITSIPESYFNNISSLTTVGIPSTVEEVYSYAFNDTKINTIYYGGSIDNYFNISFNDNYKITSNGDLEIFEKDENGDVEVEGVKYSQVEEFKIPSGITALTTDNISIPKFAKRVIIPEGVVEIGDSVFSNCTNLREVVLPSTLKTIGLGAFYQCKQLNKITLPEGLESIGFRAFAYTALSYVEIPSTVTTLGEYVFENSKLMIAIIKSKSIDTVGAGTFYGCKNLQAASYATDIISIGASAFFNCQLLAKFNISKDLESIGASAFKAAGIASMDLSNTKVTSIEKSTFESCKRLSNVKLPDGITSIGASAFKNTAITSIDLSKLNIDTISEYAFYGCTKLVNIQMPSNVKSIETGAFENCNGIECTEYENGLYMGGNDNPYKYLIKIKNDDIVSFKLNENCEVAGVGLFKNCKNLKKFEIPSNITYIGQYLKGCSSVEELIVPFVGDAVGNKRTTGYLNWIFGLANNDKSTAPVYSSLKKVTLTNTTEIYGSAFGYSTIEEIILPETLTKIDSYAFGDCKNLKEIQIPSTVTLLGDHVFHNCYGIEEMDLSDLAELELETCVFLNCTGLTNVNLPAYITTIPNSTFSGCTKITSFDFSGIEEINQQAFYGTGFVSITLPSSITKLGVGAFQSCNSLETVIFEGENVTLASSVFAYDKKLTNVTLPSKLTEIGESMFQNDTLLTTLNLPTTVKTIGASAFKSSGITSFDFTYITTINKNAFESSMIESVSLSKKVTSFGAYVFKTCPNLAEVYVDCESFGNYMFQGCSNLVKATFGDNNKTINSYAFTNCSKLADLTLSKNLTRICYCAFDGCYALKSFVLHYYHNVYDYFPQIEKYVFQNCISLTKVYFTGTGYLYNIGVNGSNAFGKSIEKEGNSIFLREGCVVIYSEDEPTDTDYTYWHYDEDNKPVIWVVESSNE